MKRKKYADHPSWMTRREVSTRRFNRRAFLFLTGTFLPAYRLKENAFRKMTARVCKPKTTTIKLRNEVY